MVRGADLWREMPPAWDARGSCLLLNPRMASGQREKILAAGFPDLAEHVWVASSGTSGRLKIVALSRAALESSAAAVNRHLGAGASDCWVNPLPLFHVGGVGIVVRAALAGARCEMLEQWSPQEFVRRAAGCGATLSSLVPAQLHDVVAARLPSPPALRAVVVGGGFLEDSLHARAAELGWPVLRSYGMTEAASQVATARVGDDFSGWLPLLEHVEGRTDEEGVLELRGPSLLSGWLVFGEDGAARWEDPKSDGWFRTSDRVELRGRELRVLGRADDLVKIRGELVDIGALETALQARVTGGRIAVQCLPDERNGAALRVVAESAAALKQAGALRDEIFPPYARPQEFVEAPVEVTALGKTVRRPR